MHLHVNSNLALELPPDTVPPSLAPKKKTDPRAELASQFIPAGARVLDLSGSTAIATPVAGLAAAIAVSTAPARNAQRSSAI